MFYCPDCTSPGRPRAFVARRVLEASAVWSVPGCFRPELTAPDCSEAQSPDRTHRPAALEGTWLARASLDWFGLQLLSLVVRAALVTSAHIRRIVSNRLQRPFLLSHLVSVSEEDLPRSPRFPSVPVDSDPWEGCSPTVSASAGSGLWVGPRRSWGHRLAGSIHRAAWGPSEVHRGARLLTRAGRSDCLRFLRSAVVQRMAL